MIKKHIIFVTITLVYAALLGLLLWHRPNGAPGPRYAAVESGNEAVKRVYRLNFQLSRAPAGTAGLFLPRYIDISAETAANYAGGFYRRGRWQSSRKPTGVLPSAPAKIQDISGGPIDAGEYYLYGDEQGTLRVYKYLSLIQYAASPRPAPDGRGAFLPEDPALTDKEAIKLASEHIENKFLLLNYSEAVVDFESEEYKITFIHRLGNIRDYAFPVVVTLDADGGLKAFDYYYVTYQRFDECRIKSMEQAFNELPVDFASDTEINLTKCNLVYVFKDSFLQPAYLFEGELDGGRFYKCFVDAAVYN
ncbi:MAG: hypothetical protein LBS62_10680 [Clostridiales bacterium]|jgi:hypothetical protein|nr:hypothetical protein [Clostridiales bacterium]